jgi:hypothetical protein
MDCVNGQTRPQRAALSRTDEPGAGIKDENENEGDTKTETLGKLCLNSPDPLQHAVDGMAERVGTVRFLQE